MFDTSYEHIIVIYIVIIFHISSGSFLYIRGYKKLPKSSRSLSSFECWTRRKCQTNTFRLTLAPLNFGGLR